ncbi:MAG: NAD(P)-dependent oxidoreductase [Rhodoglobus sp.]
MITGATGFIGRAVVRAALDSGMQVTALTRNPDKLQPSRGLTIISTETTDLATLRRVLPGHDAVIHCLGVGGTGTRQRTTVISEATAVLVTAMLDSGVNRLVALSNIGAGSSAQQGAWIYRKIIRPIVIGLFLRWLQPIIDDKNRMEPIIMESALDWTIARLPNVVERRDRRSFRLSLGSASVGLSIGNTDLATFLIVATKTSALHRVAVSVSN